MRSSTSSELDVVTIYLVEAARKPTHDALRIHVNKKHKVQSIVAAM